MAKCTIIIQGKALGKERRPVHGSNLRQQRIVACLWNETLSRPEYSVGVPLQEALLDYPQRPLDQSLRKQISKLLRHGSSVPSYDVETYFEKQGGDRRMRVTKQSRSFFASKEKKLIEQQMRRNKKDRDQFVDLEGAAPSTSRM